LYLLCTARNFSKEKLDIWPTLPIEVRFQWDRWWDKCDADNIVSGLERHERVRCISLINIFSTLFERFNAAMQVPFPELTDLKLKLLHPSPLVPPGSFLGGSAPQLRSLELYKVSFPEIHKLLLSASLLVQLVLWDIPRSGYVSPEAMVTCLSSLTALESLRLGFRFPHPRPNQIAPPPLKRTVLPALTNLSFRGTSEYSEDFLARVDTAFLHELSIRFLIDPGSNISRLCEFINRAEGLNPLKQVNQAEVAFRTYSIQLQLNQPGGPTLTITCERQGRQVPLMAPVLICSQLSLFFSHVRRLDLIRGRPPKPGREDDTEPTQFLGLLQKFPAVQGLYVSDRLVPFITHALQKLTDEGATEVLPELRNLFLEGLGFEPSGPVLELVMPFVAMRQLSGHPVTVHPWEGGKETGDHDA
jgi:hypothetical protein